MSNLTNPGNLSETMSFRFSRLIKIRELSALIGGALVYFTVFSLIDHRIHYLVLVPLLMLFAVLKVAYLLIYTFKRVEGIIKTCHTFYELLFSISLVALLIILSFTLDFTCLSYSIPNAFKGIELNFGIIRTFFEFMYFSVVTFATIGYGDITPVSLSAKFLVSLEILTSFVVIVFLFSNIEKIKTLTLHRTHVKEKNKNYKEGSPHKGGINE